MSNHTASNTMPSNSAPVIQSSITANNLKSLGIIADTLLFGLKYQYTEAPLSGWFNKVRSKTGEMDIDISCMLYDKRCNLCDLVWFKQLRDQSQAVRHHGDSLNGKDRGQQALYDAPLDPEQISLKLSKIPEHIVHIALVVSSYHKQPLAAVKAGQVHLRDDEANQAFELNLKSLDKDCQALWVASLRREVDDWNLTQQMLPVDSTDIPTIAKLVSHELARSLPMT